MGEAMIRVFLATRNQLVGEQLEGVEDISVVGKGRARQDILKKIADLLPEVLLIDLGIDRNQGMEIVKDIRAQFQPVKILAIARDVSHAQVNAAVKEGCNGCIPISSSLELVIEGIRKVYQGKSFLRVEVQEAKEAEQQARLVVYEKDRKARAFELDQKTILIGRGQKAHLKLPNVSVSRQHAVITRVRKRWVAAALNENNSILLNGEKIKKAPLKDNDQLQIGRYLLVFQAREATENSVDMIDWISMPGLATSAQTEKLSTVNLKQVNQEIHLCRNAHVISQGDEMSWYPMISLMSCMYVRLIKKLAKPTMSINNFRVMDQNPLKLLL